jgi:RNA polymerase sigma-70 factor (ECF subfamily)
VTTDTELVGRFQAGEEGVFDELLARHEARLYAFVCTLVGTPEADDVMQEVVLAVYRSLPTFRGDSSFSTWLYRVVANTCSRYRRRWRRRPLVLAFSECPPETLLAIPDAAPGPERSALDAEFHERLEQAIAALSPLHRAVVHLRYTEELSYQDIAEALDIPLGTVRSRLHHALEKLGAMLRPYWEGREEGETLDHETRTSGRKVGCLPG